MITQGKLSDLCPIMNARMEDRTNIEWNKDDIDTLGFLKIDVLALGMLTCIRKAFDLAKIHYGLNLTLANIPQDQLHPVIMIECPRLLFPFARQMVAEAVRNGGFSYSSAATGSWKPMNGKLRSTLEGAVARIFLLLRRGNGVDVGRVRRERRR